MSPEVKLLIVDDDEELCQTLADIFEEKGYQAQTAHSGKEALSQASEQQFNIALLDVKLPDVSGVELFHKLKEMNPGMKGIIITAYATLESALEALHQGVFDYIMKPLNLEEVIGSVNSALERQRALLEEKERLSRETEEKEFYRSLSFVDSLTGLYNRRRFQEVIAQEIARARRYSHKLALMMIDIDHFKKYNDAHGHPAGDAALKHIARSILRSVRGTDIVARYGGEEFTVLIPETDKEAAVVAAERVRKAVARARLPSGKRLTVSIGLASYPTDAEDKEQLILRADQALYRAKRAGRNMTKVWGINNPGGGGNTAQTKVLTKTR